MIKRVLVSGAVVLGLVAIACSGDSGDGGGGNNCGNSDKPTIVTDRDVIFQSQTIRLEEELSGGGHRQVYLLIPPPGAGGHVLGIDCINDCVPMEEHPWVFSIVPVAELKP